MQVPIASITDRGHGTGVWVLNDKTSTVSFRPVKVLAWARRMPLSRTAYIQGKRSSAIGAHLLQDGQRVRVVDEKLASR